MAKSAGVLPDPYEVAPLGSEEAWPASPRGERTAGSATDTPGTVLNTSAFGRAKEHAMTINDNFRSGPLFATSRSGIGGGGRTFPHLVGRRPRHNSQWNNTWMALGKCRDMDPALFFPCDGPSLRAAQRICAVCPMKVPCLEYALANRMDEGVWGGTSEQERRRVLSQRRYGA
jgi:WhiB family redox-sensing transcriptional regulator